MRNRLRSAPLWHALHAGAGVAALVLAGPAAADSAVGVDTLLGNGANPQGLDPTVAPGKTAIGSFRPNGSRTPTGLRYLAPPDHPAPLDLGNGWNYNLSLDIGYWGKDGGTSNPLFRQYRDWQNGLALDWFGFRAESPADARYLSVVASGVGRRDQFYGFEAGVYNEFRLKAFVDQIPHALGTGSTYFSGTGTERMTLPASLTPGTSALSAIDAADKLGAPYAFKVQRDRAGVRGEWTISGAWKAYSSYTFQRRTGSRPAGGSMFFPLALAPGVIIGGISELAEPIDDKTHDVAAGVQYASALTQFNLAVTASLFRNAYSSLTWENPYNVAFPGPSNAANLRLGQLALSPDNEAYNVKADFVRAIPELRNAHFSAGVSIGRMTQNAALLAPSVNTGQGGSVPMVWDNADWNTTAALSQKTADARIDTALVNLQFSAAPADRLNVTAKARHYETRNRTEYTAFNPVTKQYGFLQEGGGAGTVIGSESGIYSPGTQSTHYRSIPFDGSQQNLSLAADYRLTSKTTISGSYERENYLRHHRERARTWDDKLKASVVDRHFGDGTLRGSYEYSSRRGSPYNYDPYEAFYTSSLPGATPSLAPHTMAEMRKYDLSDRKQQVLNLRYNRPLGDDVDAGVGVQDKVTDWDAGFGRIGRQSQTSLNLDMGWTPVDGTTAYAYYSYERSRIPQANVNDNAASNFGSPNYGGDVFLTQGAWNAVSKDRTDVLGLGMKKSFSRDVVLDLAYSFTRSVTTVEYGYLDPGGAVLGQPGAPLPDIGNAFPDMTYRIHSLQGSLVVPVSKRVSWRFVTRYEKLSIQDWHYTGLAPGALPSNAGGLLPVTYIDRGPTGYHALVLGVFFQFKL